MDLKQTIETLELLLAGHSVGELELRATYTTALVYLRGLAEREESAGSTRRGFAWSPSEESNLLKEFQSGASVETLAARSGRSVSSVHSRLTKLGAIEE